MYWLLTNNIGLGLRNFAIHVKNNLGLSGEEAQVLFRESYIDADSAKRIMTYRDLLNNNPAAAVLARAATYQSLSEPIDDARAGPLFAAWQRDPDPIFVIVAYRWIPTLAKFKAQTGKDVRVVILSMDCAGDLLVGYENFGISGTQLPCYDTERLGITHFITANRLIDFDAPMCGNGIVVQGGGWQLGVDNLDPILPEYKLSYVIRPDQFQSPLLLSGAKCFADESMGFFDFSQDFPKFGPLEEGAHILTQVGDTPGALTLLRNSVAQITKPGGMSIMDSICTGRPLILREPISGDEKLNLAFCLNSGIGVMLEDFLAEANKEALLGKMSGRIQVMRRNARPLVDAILSNAEVAPFQ